MDKYFVRALLIEDNPGDHRLIMRSFSKMHSTIEVVWAQTLAEGLTHLTQDKFDVVVTDLSLPDSVGLKTVEHIRLNDQKTPVVVLTELDDVKAELKSLTVGVQDYLSKSESTPRTLERAIQHAIQRQQSIVEVQRLLTEVEANRELLKEQKEQLKRKNHRLRRLYKTAHQFVDNVSHEFRTPLTVIQDYVSLVREGMVGEVNAEQRRMLDTVCVRADELNNMVDDMLDVSKLESGLLGAWRRSCRLSDIVESVCPPLERRAAVKNITFKIDVDRHLPLVYCDSEKIGRAIINLVTNGMKFCGHPGFVRLWAREPENSHDELIVGVTDNGPGIDEQGLSQIFQRFKQLDTRSQGSTKGFGLGLSIAKELVDLNYGQISVDSHPGKGTTFSFTVPLDKPAGVMERYLKRSLKHRNTGAVIAFLKTSVSPDVSDEQADDADAFFNYLLRQTDLVFRAGHHDWLFVLQILRSELSAFEPRAHQEWEKTNRNRPFGPIPPFVTSIESIWNLNSDPQTILAEFNRLMQHDNALT